MSQMFSLYFLFAKIAIFTFGGGYAMIPLFESELVEHWHLLSPHDFANMVALAQMTPGPVGLNAATYIGYQQGMAWAGIPGGIFGATLSTLGIVTPTLILMTLVISFLIMFKKNDYIQALLSGIRPTTIGLIASAVIFFANTSIFTVPIQTLWQEGSESGFGVSWQGCVIFLLTVAARMKTKWNLFYILSGSVILGILLYLI